MKQNKKQQIDPEIYEKVKNEVMTNRNLTLDEIRIKYNVPIYFFRMNFLRIRPFTIKKSISLNDSPQKITIKPLKVIKKYGPNGMVKDLPEELNKTKYSLIDLSKVGLGKCNN